MQQLCSQEIIGLHQFFEGWFLGRLPQTEAAFGRCATALAADFHIIGPDARLTKRGPLLTGLWQAHGRWHNGRIWIENVVLRHHQGDLALATYEEWQEIEGQPATARLSSVLFRRETAAPTGLVWLHVHETWMEKR